jgi:hypothetical protein
MYELGSGNPSKFEESAPRECKPDYEKMAAKQQAELLVVENFKQSLLELIGVIGVHSFRNDTSTIPELLGIVELDIIKRTAQYGRTLELLEKDKA